MLKEKIIKDLIKKNPKNAKELDQFKKEISQKYKTFYFISNSDLLKAYHKFIEKKRIKRNERLERLLRVKPVRSLSGIVNISVLTKPYPCPGQCIFCPTEPDLPKSYLSGEPAVERAKKLKFSPYWQTKKRIDALEAIGHPTDKIELRIIGGTWNFYPKNYQKWFIKRCFDACNGKKSKNLSEAQRLNEKAKNRIVGISVETRPDFVNEKEILWLRKLGVTLVEIGVQTIFDDIHKLNRTNLTQEKIIKATKLLKDAGFKILYHLMINLPGSNPQKDLECARIVFSNSDFKPDWVKIYPVSVTKNTLLYELYKKGRYKIYSEEELVKILMKIKKELPYWVRVARVMRDIPSFQIEAGCKTSNLREIVKKKMIERNLFCKCIRCREVRGQYNPKEEIYFLREDYQASEGKEIFLSFENRERTKLYSFLRLRIPSEDAIKNHFIKILRGSAIIREIQTFGEMVPIGGKKQAVQHRGLGEKLIKEAERIAKEEFKIKKIAVIAGVGVRNYFRKLGYKLKKTFMIKEFQG